MRSLVIKLSYVLVIGVTMCLLVVPALADDGRLASLACVRVNVESSPRDEDAFGIRRDGLDSGVLVRLRAKLPRLAVRADCNNILYVKLGIDHLGERPGYYGGVLLQVYRPVRLLETGETITAATFSALGVVKGPSPGHQHVLQTIEGLLDEFGAAYYKDGNR